MNTRTRLTVLGCTSALLIAGTCSAATTTHDRSVATPAAPVHQAQQRIELPPLGRILMTPSRPSPAVKGKAASRATSTPKKTSKPVRKSVPAERVTRISGYVYCGSKVASAQRCIDAGKLTLYRPSGVRTLAGHNYMGWAWMDDLPVGRKVVITSGGLAGTYRVYGHGHAARGSRGGTFPAAGLGASVALQTCAGEGTGFSFLRRVSGG